MTANSPWKSRQLPTTLCLFDVDGTLTPSRGKISPEMKEALVRLRENKQMDQLGDNVLDEFDFCFSENGLVSYRCGVPLKKESFINFLGEDKYKHLVNFTLRYIADLDLPVKRGTFIEFRNGMVNISPIGRNCSQEERKAFLKYDQEHGIRPDLVAKLQKEFPDYGLKYSIGGEISIDVFPIGWDKTYALRHLDHENFDVVHFFGDKTMPGGNDYEIYSSGKVTGHAVRDPNDTLHILNQLFGV
ncbi:Phosphomannomutase [Smittium mucronatum]|uniref:Phosphomannomutase n=1 Tax=Smittium mucronatum TaxID=133383 RepID=A0A1R0H947_9FUNG|nr:Phosphomannomutase [Smittium mucronatum]